MQRTSGTRPLARTARPRAKPAAQGLLRRIRIKKAWKQTVRGRSVTATCERASQPMEVPRMRALSRVGSAKRKPRPSRVMGRRAAISGGKPRVSNVAMSQ